MSKEQKSPTKQTNKLLKSLQDPCNPY